jgi:hypothetical protein
MNQIETQCTPIFNKMCSRLLDLFQVFKVKLTLQFICNSNLVCDVQLSRVYDDYDIDFNTGE